MLLQYIPNNIVHLVQSSLSPMFLSVWRCFIYCVEITLKWNNKRHFPKCLNKENGKFKVVIKAGLIPNGPVILH